MNRKNLRRRDVDGDDDDDRGDTGTADTLAPAASTLESEFRSISLEAHQQNTAVKEGQPPKLATIQTCGDFDIVEGSGDGKRRRAICRRRVKAGSLLFEESPIAAVLNNDAARSHCDYTFAMPLEQNQVASWGCMPLATSNHHTNDILPQHACISSCFTVTFSSTSAREVGRPDTLPEKLKKRPGKNTTAR